MVDHENVGVDDTAMTDGLLGEPIQIDAAVGIIEEDRLPIIPSLNHMHRHFRKKEASLAGHLKTAA
jgi:hypothetical protein